MVQQELQDAGVPTVAVGKIGDIYAHVGWNESYPTRIQFPWHEYGSIPTWFLL